MVGDPARGNQNKGKAKVKMEKEEKEQAGRGGGEENVLGNETNEIQRVSLASQPFNRARMKSIYQKKRQIDGWNDRRQG